MSHGLAPSTQRIQSCLPEKGPLTQSPPRTREKTSHRGRVREEEEEEERGLVGVVSCWASMIKVSPGRIRDGRMGNLALGLTWQICQGGRATGDFHQIVNYPFRTARAKQPNPPLASPREQRLISVPDTEFNMPVCLFSSPPRSAAQNCSALPVRCIFQNRRSRRRPSIGQTLRARYDRGYSAARDSSTSVEIL